MADQHVCNIEFFIYLRFIAGYYHEFGVSRKSRYLSILYCILHLTVTLYIEFEFSDTKDLGYGLFDALMVVENVMYIIVSINTKNEYLLQFYKKIAHVDDMTNAGSYKMLHVLLVVIVTILMIYNIVIRAIYFYIFHEEVSIGIIGTAIDIASIIYALLGRLTVTTVFLFALLYCRVKSFRTRMESNNFDCKSLSKNHPRQYIQMYETIMDSFEATDNPVKLQLFGYIVLSIPYATYINLSLLEITKHYDSSYSKFVMWVALDTVLGHMPLIVSAILSDLITEEVQKILAIIVQKRVMTKNERDYAEIQKLFEYVRSRPFNYTLCRAVPLNMRALLAYTSFTLTTCIAVTQVKGFSLN